MTVISDHPPLLIDDHEPKLIYDLLEQSCPVEYAALNMGGLADYLWLDVQGNTRQIERKQWGEILGGIDHVENQLRGEIVRADATDLLIEGIVRSTQWGLDAYVWDQYKQNYRFSHSFGDPKHPQVGLYSKVMAWIWQLNAAGVGVWFTFSAEDTAKAIAAFYSNSLKTEHTTLNRYLKPKIYVKNLNTAVLSLMGLEGAGLGATRAKALVERFGSVWGVLSADVKELASVDKMGTKTAEKLLRAVGREPRFPHPKE